MNIVDICKYLRISPLVRRIGTEQVLSQEPIGDILQQNFEIAIKSLPGGVNAPNEQAKITQAYFDAAKALKGHEDLTHLISTPEELGGVLKEIQLNEIQPLLLHLINKEPAEASLINFMFDMTVIDKLITGIATTSVASGAVGVLGAAASLYVTYRVSEKFMQRMFAEPPKNELDRLIVNEDALKCVITELSEIKLCEALMILRHVSCYQQIMENYQPQKNTPKLALMGVDLTPGLLVNVGKNIFQQAQPNKLKRSLRETDPTDNLTKHLQNSRLLNNAEKFLIELFKGQQDKFTYVMMIVSFLEIINTLDKVTLFTKQEDSWNNLVDAHQKIYFLFKLIKQGHNKLIALLNEEEISELNRILSVYLPIHFYSYLQNAIVTNPDDIFPKGRIDYYNGAIKTSGIDEEIKAQLDLCLPEMRGFSALDDHKEEEPLEILDDTSAAAIHDTDVAAIYEEKEGSQDGSSDVEFKYYDAQSGPSSCSDESVNGKNSPLSDKDQFAFSKKSLFATQRLNLEELVALTQQLKECLKENCIRITQELGRYSKSREAIRKKISFLTRCYVTLDHLTFDTEENIVTNRALLASICVQVFLISSIETNYLSLLTELSSGTLDAVASTKTYGSTSLKDIKSLLDKYEFQVLKNEEDIGRIVRCFNDGIWPVVCGTLFHFERALYDTQQKNEPPLDTDTASAVSNHSFFSLGESIPAFLNPATFRETVSNGMQMISEYYAHLIRHCTRSSEQQPADTDEVQEEHSMG